MGVGEAEAEAETGAGARCLAEGEHRWSMLLERLPFTSLPTLLRPMAEKNRRSESLDLPSCSIMALLSTGVQRCQCSHGNKSTLMSP